MIRIYRKIRRIFAVLLGAALVFGITPGRALAAEKAYRVVDLNEAATLPDGLFPQLEGWQPPARVKPAYAVYQNTALLGRFDDKAAAIAQAKRYAHAAVVAEGLLYENGAALDRVAYNAGAFAVYQADELLRLFPRWADARRYADLWSGHAVAGLAVVWHNYAAEPDLLANAATLAAYDTLAAAIAHAKALDGRPAVVSVEKPVVLWEKTTLSASALVRDVPHIAQMPELPRGCEVTALAMLLRHTGVNADKMTLAREVRKSPLRYDDPNNGFIGDMYSFATHGLGVYHAPIAELARKYAANVADATGAAFDDLLYYLDNDHPVWIIINARFKRLSASDYVTWHTPAGSIKVTYWEHAVLVVGYDDKYIYYNDPLEGAYERQPKANFIAAWEQMGKQAVTILP